MFLVKQNHICVTNICLNSVLKIEKKSKLQFIIFLF